MKNLIVVMAVAVFVLSASLIYVWYMKNEEVKINYAEENRGEIKIVETLFQNTILKKDLKEVAKGTGLTEYEDNHVFFVHKYIAKDFKNARVKGELVQITEIYDDKTGIYIGGQLKVLK